MSREIRKRSYLRKNMDSKGHREASYDYSGFSYDDGHCNVVNEQRSLPTSNDLVAKKVQKDLRHERILRRQYQIETDRLKAEILSLKEQVSKITNEIEQEKHTTKDKIDNMMKQLVQVDIIPKGPLNIVEAGKTESNQGDDKLNEINQLKSLNENLLKKIDILLAKNENLKRSRDPIDLEIKIVDQDQDPDECMMFMEKIKILKENSAKLKEENRRLQHENKTLLASLKSLHNYEPKTNEVKEATKLKDVDHKDLRNQVAMLEFREKSLQYTNKKLQKQIQKLLQRIETLESIQSKEDDLSYRSDLLKKIEKQKRDISELMSTIHRVQKNEKM